MSNQQVFPLLGDGTWIFDCVQHYYYLEKEAKVKDVASLRQDPENSFTWKEASEALYNSHGWQSIWLLLEMQTVSLAAPETAQEKLTSLRKMLSDPVYRAIVTHETCKEILHEKLCKHLKKTIGALDITFFNVESVQAYVRVLRKKSAHVVNITTQNMDNLRFLEQVSTASFWDRVEKTFSSTLDCVATGLGIKTSHDALTQASNINKVSSVAARNGRLLLNELVEVLRFTNCPEPPRFYSQYMVHTTKEGKEPFDMTNHKDLFLLLFQDRNAIVVLKHEHEEPLLLKSNNHKSTAVVANNETSQISLFMEGSSTNINQTCNGPIGALKAIEQWAMSFKCILNMCKVINETDITESKSVFTDKALHARRRIAADVTYHRKTLRFDRDRKEFVFAAGADEELVQKRIIDQRIETQRQIRNSEKKLSPTQLRERNSALALRNERELLRQKKRGDTSVESSTTCYNEQSDLLRSSLEKNSKQVPECRFTALMTKKMKKNKKKTKKTRFALPKKKKSNFRDAELDRRLIKTVHQRRVIASRSLLGSGAYIETKGMTPGNSVGGATPLIMASRFGDVAMVQMLLQQKANIHAEDDMGWSTLISAINIGHYNLTQLLLKKKASPHATAQDGTSPLMVAARQGYSKICFTLLLLPNPNPSHQAENGRDALMLAANYGRKTCVAALLQAKSNVNALDVDGACALSFAVKNGYGDIAAALLDAGADSTIEDALGYSPMQVAQNHGYTRLVFLMKEPNSRGRDRILKTFRNAQKMLLAQMASEGKQLSQNLSSVDISVREKLAELQNQRAAKEKAIQEEQQAALLEEKQRQAELHAKMRAAKLAREQRIVEKNRRIQLTGIDNQEALNSKTQSDRQDLLDQLYQGIDASNPAEQVRVMKARLALRNAITEAAKAFEARKLKLDAGDIMIVDIGAGLRDLTKAVEIGIEELGRNHKFIDEAMKWQARLHTQIKKYELLRR